MEKVGAKTKRLLALKRIGLLVPDFVYFDSTRTEACLDGKGAIRREVLEEIIDEIRLHLPVQKYAVRSSALIEDGENSSYAGQFKTCLAVDLAGLPKAIAAVLRQAFDYFKGDVSHFSFFVQEFIEPDQAGVTFTRNPIAGQEMIINFASGRGEALVSGKKTGKIIYVQRLDDFSGPIFLKEEIGNFRKLEKYFEAPQDIEWCVKDNRFYYLQCRDITTLGKVSPKQYAYLENFLAGRQDYYYSRAGLTESAPRPVTFTLDLIKKLYQVNGPIESVYQKFGIDYFANDFLFLIGNQLYIDKEKELQTLYPAQSYLISENLGLAYKGFSHLVVNLKNIYRLSSIDLGDIQGLRENLASFSVISDELEISSLIDDFFDFYKIIFEINLKADIALKRLNKEDQNQAAKASLSVSTKTDVSLSGNSLDVADETPFVSFTYPTFREKQRSISSDLLIYHDYQVLREAGRQAVVRKINRIRESLFGIALCHGFRDQRMIYHSRLDEVLRDKIQEGLCSARKEQYHHFDDYNFPSLISDRKIPLQKEIFLSEGQASGKLVLAEEIGGETGDIILYTDVLSPDLLRYFDRIKGIVTENGSILSHLAILARERKIPVLLSARMRAKIGQVIDL